MIIIALVVKIFNLLIIKVKIGIKMRPTGIGYRSPREKTPAYYTTYVRKHATNSSST